LGFEIFSDRGPMLQGVGLSKIFAKKRLHVRTQDGNVMVGVDAFLALWAEMPIYKFFGRLVGIPGVYHLAVIAYDHVLAPLLFWWDKRRLLCDDNACS
jgi:hypothetical protein